MANLSEYPIVGEIFQSLSIENPVHQIIFLIVLVIIGLIIIKRIFNPKKKGVSKKSLEKLSKKQLINYVLKSSK